MRMSALLDRWGTDCIGSERGERGGGRGQVGCALVVRGVVVGGRWDVLISMWWEGQGGWGQVGSVLAKRGVWGVPPIVIDKIK